MSDGEEPYPDAGKWIGRRQQVEHFWLVGEFRSEDAGPEFEGGPDRLGLHTMTLNLVTRGYDVNVETDTEPTYQALVFTLEQAEELAHAMPRYIAEQRRSDNA